MFSSLWAFALTVYFRVFSLYRYIASFWGGFTFLLVPCDKFATYFQHYYDDRLFLKLAVGGLVLFTILKSCQSLCVTQIKNGPELGFLHL